MDICCGSILSGLGSIFIFLCFAGLSLRGEKLQNGCYGPTDFASEGSLTIGIVFIWVTCKLFEFFGFLYSGHVTFQIWS